MSNTRKFKAPFDIESIGVEKGHIFEVSGIDTKEFEKRGKVLYYRPQGAIGISYDNRLPAEIVEQWEEVFDEVTTDDIVVGKTILVKKGYDYESLVVGKEGLFVIAFDKKIPIDNINKFYTIKQ